MTTPAWAVRATPGGEERRAAELRNPGGEDPCVFGPRAPGGEERRVGGPRDPGDEERRAAELRNPGGELPAWSPLATHCFGVNRVRDRSTPALTNARWGTA